MHTAHCDQTTSDKSLWNLTFIPTQCVFTYQAFTYQVSSRWKEENGWTGVCEHIYQLFSQVLLYVICLNCLTSIETALSVLGF